MFLAALIAVAVCVFLLSFNIIFRKDGQFPDGEIGHNKELRKKGLMCAKEEERRLWGYHKKKKDGTASCGSCSDCFADDCIKIEKK